MAGRNQFLKLAQTIATPIQYLAALQSERQATIMALNWFDETVFTDGQAEIFAGPVYGDRNGSLNWFISSSEYTEPQLFVGEEASKLLSRYAIERSLPDESAIGSPFGTIEEPALIPSYDIYRIVGCQGRYEKSHPVYFMRLLRDQVTLCPVCDQAFKLVEPTLKVYIKPALSLLDKQAETFDKEIFPHLTSAEIDAAIEEVEGAFLDEEMEDPELREIE